MFRYESLEDCPLDEEESFQVLGEEDEEIDQFNDDTFGAGAIDGDWREEHERLAELEDKPTTVEETGAPTQKSGSVPIREETGGLLEGRGENLARSLRKLVIESELEDPAVMSAIHSRSRPPMQLSRSLNSSIWDSPAILRHMRAPMLSEDMAPSSIMQEYDLAHRLQQSREEPERELSERALPRRSTSPVIGSPPVRAVPIGTPPKQVTMANFSQQQILCPKAVHIRAPVQQRFTPPSYNDQLSPNPLCGVSNSSLLGHPFSASVPSVLTPLQRAQLIGGAQQQAAVAAAGRMSPSQFARVSGLIGTPLTSVNPKILQTRVGQMMAPAPGFRAFFGAPPPPSPLVPTASHLQNLRPQPQMFRPDTTFLHPQHRRLLNQRQEYRNQNRNLNGAGDRAHHSMLQDQLRKDPYANLMMQREKLWVSKIQMMQLQSTDPYLDDYYYQNYFEKLEKLAATDDSHSEGPKKERTRLITPQVAKLEHAYKPVQFEGSLGKLTVSSVNNPRKMIDAVVTSRSEDDETKEKQVRDKRRQTLVIIEKTFTLLLDVEDYEKRYHRNLMEEQAALLEERKHKILNMYENLRGKPLGHERPSDDLFVQMMCIRKGKRMVARILPYLSLEQAASLVSTTAHNLAFFIKKDAQDEVLPCLLRPCAFVLSQLPSEAVTNILQQLINLPQNTTSSQQPEPSNPHFTAVLQNRFGLSLLYQILSRGEQILSSATAKDLMQDNQWTDLVFRVTRELLRVPTSSLATAICIPSNLQSLFSRYVDRQNLNLLETKLKLVPGTR
ncbi:protein PAT1 homolog 1 [Ambystoma mexicanum]|uniref:protein PAT1 homolog 1 n=1 Tax=Ambystoma mexicanum TaxID=8296 RepID=UPI0037E7378A